MSHVVIVGAGPAGASLAHLLAHRGVEVTLLERQRDFAREFRGEVLTPSGIDALGQIGVADGIESLPAQELDDIAVYMSRRLVLHEEIDFAALGSSPPRAVSQPALLEMLVAESAKSPHFRFERGVAAKELLLDQDRVVGVRAQTEDGPRDLRADLVIGADGRGSSVRRHADLPVHDLGQPMDVVWCKVPCPDDWTGARAYAGRGHLLIGYRTWDGTLQMGWVILKGSFGELRARGVTQWVEEMAHHVTDDFAGHLRAHADAVGHPFLLSTAADCLERWSAPGLLAIGDAAHTMSPVGGQGINIALRDAIVAANHLVPVLTSPRLDDARLEAALRSIQQERMAEVAPIQRRQAQPPKVMMSHAWWGEPLRRGIAALLRRDFVRALAAREAQAFLFGVTDAKLEV